VGRIAIGNGVFIFTTFRFFDNGRTDDAGIEFPAALGSKTLLHQDRIATPMTTRVLFELVLARDKGPSASAAAYTTASVRCKMTSGSLRLLSLYSSSPASSSYDACCAKAEYVCACGDGYDFPIGG
jgi:hypothetical protein